MTFADDEWRLPVVTGLPSSERPHGTRWTSTGETTWRPYPSGWREERYDRGMVLSTRLAPTFHPLLLVILSTPVPAQEPVPPGFSTLEVLTPLGDGVQVADEVMDVAVDSAGNAYFSCATSNNVFRVTPAGTVTVVLDSTGDGLGNPFGIGRGIAVDAADNVYVTGAITQNVFKISPGGTVTEIADTTGDGLGNPIAFPTGLCVDLAGNVYVSCSIGDNAFRITPAGVVTLILDATGDGVHPLDNARSIAVDEQLNVYVGGYFSNNVFRVDPGGGVTQILDASGDGLGNTLLAPNGLAVGPGGTVYVSARGTDNVFQISPTGQVTELLDTTGDGVHPFLNPDDHSIEVTAGGVCYVTGWSSDNLFRITPSGSVLQVMSAADAGASGFDGPEGLTTDFSGAVFVACTQSDNAFRIDVAALIAPYGCGVNPAGSLTPISGVPSIGTTVTLGVDNPLGTQAPGSLPFLALATAPDPAFPCGTLVPGFGMGGAGAPGELLLGVAPPPFLVVAGAPWAGPGTPAPIALPIPVDATLLGASFFAQGLLFDMSPGRPFPSASQTPWSFKSGPELVHQVSGGYQRGHLALWVTSSRQGGRRQPVAS